MRRGQVWRMQLVPDIAAVAQRHSVVGFDRERAVVAGKRVSPMTPSTLNHRRQIQDFKVVRLDVNDRLAEGARSSIPAW